MYASLMNFVIKCLITMHATWSVEVINGMMPIFMSISISLSIYLYIYICIVCVV